ncbi:MAG TPA: hypothetical protein VJL81_14840 [Solirubrobacterales bacterium]|nr:hypothetical protein [Solirubrobacterales bacterium]
MREKLNESKAAQVGLVAVLAVLVAVLFLGKSGGSSSGGETELTVEPGEVLALATPTGMGELPSSVPQTKPLPQRFAAAYDAGETVALLVVHDGGIDDRYTKLALKAVAEIERVTPIVVPAKQISRYASVTVGLDISQLPALIVMRPKSLSHGVPQAIVAYGYQTPQSVQQTIVDASYKGPEGETYHPG